MTNDRELEEWQEQWTSRDAVPPELRKRVERELRMARYDLVVELGAAVLFGGGTVAWALWSRRPSVAVLAAAVWVFIAIALVTGRALARRAGQRRVPEAATTTAFLDFAIRSCGVRRAGIAAAAGLYPLFFSFMLVWRYQTGTFASIGAYLWSGRMLVIAAVTGVLAVLAMRGYRALGRELDNLRAMQQRFENGGGSG